MSLLTSLPNEIIVNVLSSAPDFETSARLSQSCRRLRQLYTRYFSGICIAVMKNHPKVRGEYTYEDKYKYTPPSYARLAITLYELQTKQPHPLKRLTKDAALKIIFTSSTIHRTASAVRQELHGHNSSATLSERIMAANILRTCLYEIWIHLLRSDGVERLQLSDPLIVARDLVAFLKTDRMVFVVGQLGYPDVSTIPGLEIPRPGLGRELAGRLGAAMVVRIREQNRGVREGVLEWCSGVLRGRFRRPVG